MTAADEQTPVSTETTTDPKRIASTLLRYRVLAWTTGLWLLVLTSELIARYGFAVENFKWVEPVHGWVYFVYFILTIDLAVKVRWPIMRTIATLIAGTIPFLSFFAEHSRTAQVKRDFHLA
ncbi:DUF3817 domain-containing protein [Skermania sp. ID1734]|uniref:DUF3817 domain-containing protein n=1 Tax=Skermania sp. ID1734 TaxID=2597516 RepID=UPI001180D8D3|nr:DUF3817 domain-containing protein [Skermania sp. ID1734]TSD93352.1 DUF3817 domain-containing protein [Skermania sp. ID1734]